MSMEIKELNEEEVYAIMQSDMKLWESATTLAEGNNITKRLILPFGVGEVAIKFEGVDNGLKRRAAAEQWGATIRDIIKDRIDDESITQRARLAAASRASEGESEAVGDTDSGHGAEDEATQRGGGESAVLSEAGADAVQAHAKDAQGDNGPSGTDFVARAEWLRERIEEDEARLSERRRELKALDAAIAVLTGQDERLVLIPFLQR